MPRKYPKVNRAKCSDTDPPEPQHVGVTMRATITALTLVLAMSGCGTIMGGGHDDGIPTRARESADRSFNFWTLGNGLIAMGGVGAVTDSLHEDVGLGVAMLAVGVAGLVYDYRSGGMWKYEYRREDIYAGRGWPDHLYRAVVDQRVMAGMTPDMVRASWGPPQRINRTAATYGTREQWVYGMGEYVYFEDGVVTTIQTSRRR